MGTQVDLRDDANIIERLAKNKQKPLSLEMGEKLAKELRAVKYVECSALTQVLMSSIIYSKFDELDISNLKLFAIGQEC